MTARGYAVLLPDPALSTGYGRAFVARGWGAWGAAPYTDLMALTDAATAHHRVDPDAVAPQHAVLWYETVLAFLDHHVRGRDWVVPELLR